MDYTLIKASQRLSELELGIEIDGWAVEVRWFRAMIKEREWFIRRHAHKTFEFHFAAAGDCLLQLDGASVPVPEGSFYVTPPDAYHAQRNGASPEFVEYSLNCDLRPLGAAAAAAATGMSRLRDALTAAPPLPRPDDNGAIALFASALREADARRPGFEIELRSVILRILVACARSLGMADARAAEKEASSGPDARMLRIERFVEENAALKLAPADVASHMNLSEKQVGRIVAAHTGLTTRNYIAKAKLRRAKELLATTDTTIKRLAEELGYCSEYYFSSVFRLHEGYPPSVFRESMRGGRNR